MAHIGMVSGIYDSNPALFALLYRLLGYRLYGNINYGALQMRKAGYGEPSQVVDINDQLLTHNGARWYDIFTITQQATWQYQDTHHQQMVKYLRSISDNAVINDPRFCYTLPLWQSAFRDVGHDVFVIVPYTNPLTFANNMHQHHHMSTPLALALWVSYTLSIINHTRSLPRLLVSHDALLHDWHTACQPLLAHIAPDGLPAPIIMQVDAYMQMRQHTTSKAHTVSAKIQEMPITQLAHSVYHAINQPALDEEMITTLTAKWADESAKASYHHDVGQFDMVYCDLFLDTEARIRALHERHSTELHNQHSEFSTKIRLLHEEHSKKMTMLYEKHGKYIEHQSQMFAETLTKHEQQLAHMRTTYEQEIHYLNDKIVTMQTEIDWRTHVADQQQQTLDTLGWAMRIVALGERIRRLVRKP